MWNMSLSPAFIELFLTCIGKYRCLHHVISAFILTGFRKWTFGKGAKEAEASGTQCVLSFFHASCQLLSLRNSIPGSQKTLSEPTDAGSRGMLGKNSTHKHQCTPGHQRLTLFSFLAKRLNYSIQCVSLNMRYNSTEERQWFICVCVRVRERGRNQPYIHIFWSNLLVPCVPGQTF